MAEACLKRPQNYGSRSVLLDCFLVIFSRRRLVKKRRLAAGYRHLPGGKCVQRGAREYVPIGETSKTLEPLKCPQESVGVRMKGINVQCATIPLSIGYQAASLKDVPPRCPQP